MIEVVLGHILFLSLAALCGLLIQRITPLDLTLSCLLSGVLVSIGIHLSGEHFIIQNHSLKEIVFFIILPVLIFETAWHIEPKLLVKWIGPILLLAVPGILIGGAITAVITFYLIGDSSSYPWIAAMIVGAILATTDPVAAIVTLKQCRAPKDLSILIEGESLFNDATAVLLFGVLLTFANGAQMAPEGHNLVVQFLIVCVGGLLLGALMSLVAAIIILWLQSVAASKMTLLLLAFSSFYVAEHLLHISGILAVMSAAIVVRKLLAEQEERILKGVAAAWEWIALLFTSVLFVVMGASLDFSYFSIFWAPVIIVIIATLISRGCSVYSLSWVSGILGQRIQGTWQKLLVWGGLRGAIAIALALSLPNDLPYHTLVQTLVFGSVLFTMLVQGTTTGKLIRHLKIST